MTGKRVLAVATMVASCLVAVQAQAASFTIVGGIAHTTPPFGLPLGLPNVFLTIATGDLLGGTTERTGPVVWIGLDDSGAGPDVDHDDWMGRLSASPIPERGSLTLLGTGLFAAAERLRRTHTRRSSGRSARTHRARQA